MRIALITCTKEKKGWDEPERLFPAYELYSESNYFRKSYQYAKQHADKVYILSALHHLLPEDKHLHYYDKELRGTAYIREWASIVKKQIEDTFDPEHDEFLILLSNTYFAPIKAVIRKYKYTFPVEGLRIGERMHFYYSPALTPSEQLHQYFNGLSRYRWDSIKKIPFDNGIYIVFEEGEQYSTSYFERIVRVGTHDSGGRLKLRLSDHFKRENKDGSIFRKNIGKAILNKRSDPYLPTWAINTSKPENKRYINETVQKRIEAEVTEYMRSAFSFAVIPVEDKARRLRLEKGIISTLNHDPLFTASAAWLGHFSTEDLIRDSGLWLKDGLDAASLTEEEMLSIITESKNTKLLSAKKPVLKTAVGSASRPENTMRQTGGNRLRHTERISAYIELIFEQKRAEGNTECELVSGDIGRALGLQNRMPAVCGVMYKIKDEVGGKIIYETASRQSTTIRIKYSL